MIREKQIDEMAKVMCNDCATSLAPCDLNKTGIMCDACKEQANALYNAGYRKASDVARETIEAIKDEVRKKEVWVSDFDGCAYGGYVIRITDLDDIIRRYMFDTYEEAELKKKYTEDGK